MVGIEAGTAASRGETRMRRAGRSARTAERFDDILCAMTANKSDKPRRYRKHDQFRVTVTYTDNDKSIKVFTDPERAEKYAARQKRSPFVKSAQVVKLT